MTKKQFLRAAKALAKGCKITGTLINGNGDTCAIGTLLKDAGVPDEKLKCRGIPRESEIQTLEREFGLKYDQWRPLMIINDHCNLMTVQGDVVCERRKQVISTIKTYVTEEPEKGQNEQTTVQ